MKKTVKSFAVDADIYETLFGMFKQNYVDVSLSYCLNRYIKEMLAYLQAVEQELKKTGQYSVPMSFVIETTARRPIFKTLTPAGITGERDSMLQVEVERLQREYDGYHEKGGASSLEDGGQAEIGAVAATVKLAKLVAKLAVREITERRELTDDEYIELIREEGGKPLQKALREKVAPAVKKVVRKGKSKKA